MRVKKVVSSKGSKQGLMGNERQASEALYSGAQNGTKNERIRNANG